MKKLQYLKTTYGVIAFVIFIVSLLIGYSNWFSVIVTVLCFHTSLSNIESYLNKTQVYTCVALSKTLLPSDNWEERRKYFLIDFVIMGVFSLLLATM